MDLIQIKFREKSKAIHSNYVAKTINFVAILALMMLGIKNGDSRFILFFVYGKE